MIPGIKILWHIFLWNEIFSHILSKLSFPPTFLLPPTREKKFWCLQYKKSPYFYGKKFGFFEIVRYTLPKELNPLQTVPIWVRAFGITDRRGFSYCEDIFIKSIIYDILYIFIYCKLLTYRSISIYFFCDILLLFMYLYGHKDTQIPPWTEVIFTRYLRRADRYESGNLYPCGVWREVPYPRWTADYVPGIGDHDRVSDFG